MKRWSAISAFGVLAASCTTGDEAAPPIPLEDGEYVFSHRFAEHPNIQSIDVTVQLSGNKIAVFNNNDDSVFPIGLLEAGTLMWHARANRWIIAMSTDDLLATEVGGCTDGPTTVDLELQVYWTC